MQDPAGSSYLGLDQAQIDRRSNFPPPFHAPRFFTIHSSDRTTD